MNIPLTCLRPYRSIFHNTRALGYLWSTVNNILRVRFLSMRRWPSCLHVKSSSKILSLRLASTNSSSYCISSAASSRLRSRTSTVPRKKCLTTMLTLDLCDYEVEDKSSSKPPTNILCGKKRRFQWIPFYRTTVHPCIDCQ